MSPKRLAQYFGEKLIYITYIFQKYIFGPKGRQVLLTSANLRNLKAKYALIICYYVVGRI